MWKNRKPWAGGQEEGTDGLNQQHGISTRTWKERKDSDKRRGTG